MFHSFASRALARRRSLTMIGRLLGHRQSQTTTRYAHLARHGAKSAAEKIADSLLAAVIAASGKYGDASSRLGIADLLVIRLALDPSAIDSHNGLPSLRPSMVVPDNSSALKIFVLFICRCFSAYQPRIRSQAYCCLALDKFIASNCCNASSSEIPESHPYAAATAALSAACASSSH